MNTLPPTDVCERARLSRDPRFDGRFFVAVVTTGIFCRPVCPVRPPARDNVRFYASAANALAAGYRPCLRCRPERAPTSTDWASGHPLVTSALSEINNGALDHENESAFAARLGISSRQLHRTFTSVLGVAPGEIARMRRLSVAKQLIDESEISFSDVATLAGYRSLRRFNEAIAATYGRSPTELRISASHSARLPGVTSIVMQLPLHAPYNVGWMLEFLAARSIPGIDRVIGQRYERETTVGRVSVELRGQRAILTLPLTSVLESVKRMRRLIDADADSAVIDAHLNVHPELRDTISAHPGLHVPGAWDPFELAVRAILGQQVSVAGATTLAARLVERYSNGALFPSAETLARENPASIGMPGARGAAIQALAHQVHEGAIRFDDVDAETLRAQLQNIPGIGPWTAEYISIRALSDPDAFPIHDIVLRKAMEPGTTLSPTELLSRAEAYRPWRSYAVMYLWKRMAVIRANESASKTAATRAGTANGNKRRSTATNPHRRGDIVIGNHSAKIRG